MPILCISPTPRLDTGPKDVDNFEAGTRSPSAAEHPILKVWMSVLESSVFSQLSTLKPRLSSIAVHGFTVLLPRK